MKPYCKGAPAGAMTMGGERSEAHPVLISVEGLSRVGTAPEPALGQREAPIREALCPP